MEVTYMSLPLPEENTTADTTKDTKTRRTYDYYDKFNGLTSE